MKISTTIRPALSTELNLCAGHKNADLGNVIVNGSMLIGTPVGEAPFLIPKDFDVTAANFDESNPDTTAALTRLLAHEGKVTADIELEDERDTLHNRVRSRVRKTWIGATAGSLLISGGVYGLVELQGENKFVGAASLFMGAVISAAALIKSEDEALKEADSSFHQIRHWTSQRMLFALAATRDTEVVVNKVQQNPVFRRART